MLLHEIKEIRDGQCITLDAVGESYNPDKNSGPNQGIISTGPGYQIYKRNSGVCQVIQRGKVTFEGTERECSKFAGHPSQDSTKDSIAVKGMQGSDWEIAIMDGTHMKMRMIGTEKWGIPMHINQVPDEALRQLRNQGWVKGNFFKE